MGVRADALVFVSIVEPRWTISAPRGRPRPAQRATRAARTRRGDLLTAPAARSRSCRRRSRSVRRRRPFVRSAFQTAPAARGSPFASERRRARSGTSGRRAGGAAGVPRQCVLRLRERCGGMLVGGSRTLSAPNSSRWALARQPRVPDFVFAAMFRREECRLARSTPSLSCVW